MTETAHQEPHKVEVRTQESVIREWLFKYHPLTPEKQIQELLSKLREV